MLAGIRDIYLVTPPQELDRYKKLLGEGDDFGIEITYVVQERPAGIAQAFHLTEDYITADRIALILGDNIFYGSGLTGLLEDSVAYSKRHGGALIFITKVKDPHRYGVVKFNDRGEVVAILEKPENPPSNYVVTGFYIYDREVFEIARKIEPSKRGEYEITDVNNHYLKQGKLHAVKLLRGIAWFDAGTYDSFMEATEFIAAIERRQGVMVGVLEEIAYRKGWIDEEIVRKRAEMMKKTPYGEYLLKIIEEK